jgi:hypothetical protein
MASRYMVGGECLGMRTGAMDSPSALLQNSRSHCALSVNWPADRPSPNCECRHSELPVRATSRYNVALWRVRKVLPSTGTNLRCQGKACGCPCRRTLGSADDFR